MEDTKLIKNVYFNITVVYQFRNYFNWLLIFSRDDLLHSIFIVIKLFSLILVID